MLRKPIKNIVFRNFARYRPWLNSYQCTERMLNKGFGSLITDKKLALIVILNGLRNKHKSLQISPHLNQITPCYHYN
jgi:hypothetical protein